MRRLLTLLALLGTLALVAVACTDDDAGGGEAEAPAPEADGSPDTTVPDDLVPLDDWVDEVDMACEDFQEEGDAAEAALGDDYTDAELLAFIEEAARIFEGLATDIEDAGRPDEMTDEADEYLDLVVEAQALLTEAAAADSADDAEAQVAEVGALSEDADALAEDLGLTACVEDDATDEGDGSSERAGDLVPYDDWVDEVNALCASFEDDEAALDAQMEAATTEAEALATLDDVAALLDDELAAVKAAGLPDEMTAQAEALVAQLETATAAFRELAAAETAAEVEAITSTMEDPGEGLDELSLELGLTDCADQ